MFRYSPPKSNSWGHRTRRKSATDFRSCVAAFIAEAVREYTPSWSISVAPCPTPFSNAEQAFVNELLAQITSTSVHETYVQPILEAEFDKCFELLSSQGTHFPRLAYLSLDCTYDISSWNCGQSEMKCHSCQLTEYYGTIQMLGTMLAFASVDEYRWVKAIVKRTIGVELNDKHLRPKIVKQ